MTDSSSSLETRWDLICSNIKELVSPQQFKTWFSSMVLHSESENIYSFSVPNRFLKGWIEKYYMEVLTKSVQRSVGNEAQIQLTVTDNSPDEENGSTNIEKNTSEENASPEAAHGKGSDDSIAVDPPGVAKNISTAPIASSEIKGRFPTPQNGRHAAPSANGSRVEDRASFKCVDGFFLNPNYVFDTFIIGPCNQLSYAASHVVSENLAETYNPLFIHGSSGLGKTHLLQAICHNVMERNHASKVLFLSCETFINHFITAVEKRDIGKFRARYRQIDLLLIDDIHLLANKERTQEEFFHTFNHLFSSGKQIVLTSDSFPSEIPTLEDRLVSRFKCGLVTQIYPPDFETRCAILKMKSKNRNVVLPNEVIAYLAENIDNNIRELEGAVTKVIGYATLMDRKLDLEMACEAMRDVIKKRRGAVSIDNIARTITEKFSVKLSDLQSKKRFKSIAVPRQIAMFVAKKLTTHSLQEIGAYFGGRDHSTVLHACNKIHSRITNDEGFKRFIDEMVVQVTEDA